MPLLRSLLRNPIRWVGLAAVATAPTTVLGQLQGADIAIYDDEGFFRGSAWDESITAIKAIADKYGYTYEIINPAQLNSTSNLNDLYRLWFMPGGWAGAYNRHINTPGYNNLRNFIQNGGAYMGMCAGAFFMSSRVFWQPDVSTPLEIFDDDFGGYEMQVFGGVAKGAVLDLWPWTAPTGASNLPFGGVMTQVSIDTSLVPWANESYDVLYFGGPYFIQPPGGWGEIQILATYDTPGISSDGEAAMLLMPYGDGKIFLTGPHPERSFSFVGNQFYNDPVNHEFLRGIIALLLNEGAEADFTEMGVAMEMGYSVDVPDTLPGQSYVLQISFDGGATWTDCSEPFVGEAMLTEVFVPGAKPTGSYQMRAFEVAAVAD